MSKTARVLISCAAVAMMAAAYLDFCPKTPLSFLPSFTLAFLVMLLLTPIWGRFFCAYICPLGVMQSFINFMFHPKTHVRRVCTRLAASRRQTVFRWSVLAACAILAALGFGGVAWSLTPLAVIGRAAALFGPGLAVLGIVLLLAAAGKGRIWCNWICPAGTLFDLLSRRAAYPDRVRRQCSLCQACFTSSDGSPRGAERSGSSGVTRRQVLRGAISAVAVEAAAPAALASPHRRKTRPPGAVDEVDFKRLCVGCGLCVSRCKGSCLSLSSDFSDFGQVQMDFGAGACLLSCGMDCAKACPAGALRRIPGASRRDIHMGLAEWKREICLGDGNGCTACIDACPVKALTRRNGLVEIDAHRCIGCGACEFACPASPEKAISVNGFAKQRVIHSSDSEGLAKEMRFLAEHGVAAIAAKGGKITAQKKGVGVAPLLELLDEGYIEGAMVMDRVCGRAAAAICVCGGAKSVRALVMGADAAEMLRKRSVECSAERIVPCVLDAKRIAKCPYDKAVEGIDDPAAMVEELKKLESKKGK